MRRRATPIPIGLAVCLLLAGCASSGVTISRSDQREVTVVSPVPTSPEPTSPVPTSPVPDDSGLPGIAPVAWSTCDDQPGPWQCGFITVPMDYSDPSGAEITIALTRFPAADAGNRVGSLVLNPGGPGGSGIEIAYDEAEAMPTEISDRFDIVGFDPRGIGRSTAVQCPQDFDAATDSFDGCIDLTGELLIHLGTPNVARDLEMVRRALQDERLTYLGYSYGTALGAVYADMFPDRVRALVLDGAIDPDAGLSNTDSGGGYDFYAEQDFEGTLDVFHSLCDITSNCAAGPDSRDLLSQVSDVVRDTPAPYFANGESLTRADVDDIVSTAMYSAYSWPVLGIALRDAANGDASALAAMYSWLQFGYPADMEAEADFDFANVAIRCADFENRGSGSYECADFPDTAESLPVIGPVDAAATILVIGTQHDPATPGRYAALLAGALGDAVDISWEGAGHTAFLSSGCITDIVVAYVVEQIVPEDGETCPFVEGAATVNERADVVFQSLEPDFAIDSIEPLLVEQGVPGRLARCVARAIVTSGGERLVVHQILGVDSPELAGLRSTAAMGCQLTG